MQCVPVKRDYTFDIDALLAAIKPSTRMVVLSSPSNPLGSTITAEGMNRLLAAVSESTLVMFDEA